MKNFTWAFYCTLLILSNACTPSSNTPSSNDSIKPIFTGDLEKKALEIYNDPQGVFYTCDLRLKSTAIEISRILESQRANIQELIVSKINPDVFETVKINEYPFLKAKAESPSENQWKEYAEGWDDAKQMYESLKHDLKNPRWINLNALARSLIVEDESRIMYAQHPGLRRELELMITETVEKLIQCLDISTCVDPMLTEAQLAWAKKSPYFNDLDSWIKDDQETFENRRKYLNSMYRLIGGSARRFNIVKNPLILKDGQTLIVPMDLSVFGNEMEIFSSYIEKTWSHYGLIIKIINQPIDSFKVQISNNPGERAYVSRSQKLMQLYSPTRLTTAAHEFGHVLGLRDDYFTSFDTETCKYHDQYNLGDIMSNSSTGKVLPEHIQKIKQLYDMN